MTSQRPCHQNTKSDTCTTRERACVPDAQHHKHHTGCCGVRHYTCARSCTQTRITCPCAAHFVSSLPLVPSDLSAFVTGETARTSPWFLRGSDAYIKKVELDLDLEDEQHLGYGYAYAYIVLLADMIVSSTSYFVVILTA